MDTHSVASPILGPHVSRRDDAPVVYECTRHLARLVRDLAKIDVPAKLIDFVFNIREHVGCLPLLKEVIYESWNGGTRRVRNGVQWNV